MNKHQTSIIRTAVMALHNAKHHALAIQLYDLTLPQLTDARAYKRDVAKRDRAIKAYKQARKVWHSANLAYDKAHRAIVKARATASQFDINTD